MYCPAKLKITPCSFNIIRGKLIIIICILKQENMDSLVKLFTFQDF